MLGLEYRFPAALVVAQHGEAGVAFPQLFEKLPGRGIGSALVQHIPGQEDGLGGGLCYGV